MTKRKAHAKVMPVIRTENDRRYNKEKKLLPIATFDIETPLIDKRNLMHLEDSCVWDGLMYSHYWTPAELVHHFFEHPGYRYYAHNAARFDFSFIMEDITRECRERGLTAIKDFKPVIQGEDNLIGIIIKHKNKTIFELRDSYALIPMKLEEAAAIYATTQKGDIGLGDGVSYDRTNERHIAYLHSDVLSLYEVLENFQKLVHLLFDVTLGFTAGSTALSAWRATIPTGHAYYRLHPYFEEFSRAAYYGGFVYPGTTTEIVEDVVVLDYNAAYAAQMRKGVPGRRHWRTGEYEADLPGIYKVIVQVPKGIRPPIPYRAKNNQVLWQTGTFDTTVTSIEIEYALTKGCRFQILEGIVWECIEFPFNEFLDKCEEFELRDGGVHKAVAKNMRNPLYGKFGTKLESRSYYVQLDGELPVSTETEKVYWVIDQQTGEQINHVYYKMEKNTSDCIFPHWAAWITASQRIELMKAMDVLQTPLYGDTDSIFCYRRDYERAVSQNLLPFGKRYGMLKLEKELSFAKIKGLKNYRAIDKDGKKHAKCKGVPKRHMLEIFDSDEAVEYASIRSAFMSLMHPEKPLMSVQKRSPSKWENSKSWKIKGTTIVPLHVELCQLQLE
jgi:hypothetical protein